MKPNCRWVLQAAKIGSPAVFCEKPVKYKMGQDDDERTIRKYNVFCPEHQLRADQEEEEE